MENSVHALVFIINTVLGLYTAAVLLRFLMQQVRADFYNPFAQAVMKVTNPLLLPLRRVIRPWNRIDLASLVLAVLLQLLNVIVVTALANLTHGDSDRFGYTPGFLLLWTLLKLIYILVNLYFFTILAEALMSWFNQGRNPLDGILRPVNAPLLRPVRRVLPPLSGLDFSPLVVILVLQVIGYYALPHIWPFMGL
ncbi:MAG TPA: YggT family protein [Gammaproteobacteria bacterium]|nr:YggT family protein [Gammaproteobacteria bacterium]